MYLTKMMNKETLVNIPISRVNIMLCMDDEKVASLTDEFMSRVAKRFSELFYGTHEYWHFLTEAIIEEEKLEEEKL